MPDTASCTDNCGTDKGMVMMLAKSKLLFVVIFTWHFCGIHTMALAMEEATNEVKEDRSTETRDELFSIIGRVVSVHSGDTCLLYTSPSPRD